MHRAHAPARFPVNDVFALWYMFSITFTEHPPLPPLLLRPLAPREEKATISERGENQDSPVSVNMREK